MHIMNKALFESFFFEVVRHDMSKEEAEEYVVMLEKISQRRMGHYIQRRL